MTVHDDTARYRAPGGWRRALLGFAVGVAAGVLVALVLPRDDGPRRVSTRHPAEDPGASHGSDGT